jgi:hypothetical protein
MPHQRIALEALTPNRTAAARQDAPAETAATTLSRKSTDSALDMPVGLLADRKLESDWTRVGESSRISQIGNCSIPALPFRNSLRRSDVINIDYISIEYYSTP